MTLDTGMINGSTNPFQSVGAATHPSQLQNVYGAGQSSAMSQAQAIQQLQQYAQASKEQDSWMINGQRMTFKEFADTLWPDPCPDKTMFYLKYSKDNE